MATNKDHEFLHAHGHLVVPLPDDVLASLCNLPTEIADASHPLTTDGKQPAFNLEGWAVDHITVTSPACLNAADTVMRFTKQFASVLTTAVAAIHKRIDDATGNTDPRSEFKGDHVLTQPDRFRLMRANDKGPLPTRIKNAAKKSLHVDNRADQDVLSVATLTTIGNGSQGRKIVLLDLELVDQSPERESIYALLHDIRNRKGKSNIYGEETEKLWPYMKLVEVPHGHVLFLLQELPHCVTHQRVDAPCVILYTGLIMGAKPKLVELQQILQARLRNGEGNAAYVCQKAGRSPTFNDLCKKIIRPEVCAFYGNENGNFTHSPTNLERNQLPSRKRLREDVEEQRRIDGPMQLLHVDLNDPSVALPEEAQVQRLTRVRKIRRVSIPSQDEVITIN